MAVIQRTEVTTGISEEVFQYEWKIRNFVKIQESDQLLLQQKFEANTNNSTKIRSRWQIGMKIGTENLVQIYFKLLERTGSSGGIATKVDVEYLNRTGDWCPLGSVQHETALNQEFATSFVNWHCKKTANYWNNALSTDGTLTYSIKLSLIIPELLIAAAADGIMSDFKQESITKMQTNFAALLNEVESSDVKIICSDGIELNGHKIILQARNEIFASMFRSDLSENNTGEIHIKDVSSKTMKYILHYMYTGELLPGWCEADMVVEFTYAAGKYQLTDILGMLDNSLGRDDDTFSNVTLLSLASKLALKTAEAKLMERIVKLTNTAKSSDDLLAMFGNGN